MIGFRSTRKYFITGIVTILPIVITYWFLKWLFLRVDRLLFRPLLSYVTLYIQSPWVEILSRIFIFVFLILLVSLIGFLVNLFFFKKLFSKLENFLLKFPFVGIIYKSIKQISIALVGQGRNIFKKVVLVEYPSGDKFCIGFITAEAEVFLNQAAQNELVAVFIPTTPNPTSGMLVYYPKSSIKLLDLSVEEGMRIVISAGTAVVSTDDSKE